MAAVDVGIVQAVLARDSGVPEDNVVNTWHFTTGSAWSTAVAQTMAERVRDFYIVTPTGEGAAVFSKFGSIMATTGHSVKVYRLADPTPRAIQYSLTFTATATGANSFPAEVATCMSYQGTKISGVPQSRNRGRIYLGTMAATVAVTGGDLAVDDPLQTRIGRAAKDLINKNNVTASWVVYSPTRDALDPTGYIPNPVTDGWIDDRFDTVRGRGSRGTSRKVFSATAP